MQTISLPQLGFMMYYFLQEISEATVLKLEYFNDGWNYLDWTNLILIVVAVREMAVGITLHES
jgi:hypothetical protein